MNCQSPALRTSGGLTRSKSACGFRPSALTTFMMVAYSGLPVGNRAL